MHHSNTIGSLPCYLYLLDFCHHCLYVWRVGNTMHLNIIIAIYTLDWWYLIHVCTLHFYIYSFCTCYKSQSLLSTSYKSREQPLGHFNCIISELILNLIKFHRVDKRLCQAVICSELLVLYDVISASSVCECEDGAPVLNILSKMFQDAGVSKDLHKIKFPLHLWMHACYNKIK